MIYYLSEMETSPQNDLVAESRNSVASRQGGGYRHTGAIWDMSPRARTQTVRRVCERLEKRYGRPRLGNPEDPIDDLVYVTISNKTAPRTAQATYVRVKQAFATWDDLLSSTRSSLETILEPAGLATVKSAHIYGALSRIRDDLGCCDLSKLQGYSENDAERYLRTLPGVSEKVAKCIMLYTMGFDVLPVDVHVYRIACRLGWTARKRADQCHAEIEALVPRLKRYAFHVDCVEHGRTICRPKEPVCGLCCLRTHCRHSACNEEDHHE